MTKSDHQTIHSLVPVYAALSRIVKDSVEGYAGGKYDRFIDIRTEAENAMATLATIELSMTSKKHKRRKYD